MQYGEVVSRAFAIWWRHKYLWILGILSGGGAGFNFNYGRGFGGGQNVGENGHQQMPAIAGLPTPAAFTEWVTSHLALLIGAVLVLLLIGIALFVIGCIAQPALVDAAARHDGDQHYSFREAWATGRPLLWRVLGFRLLVLAAAVVPALVVAALFAGAIALLTQAVALGVLLILLAIGLGLLLIAYLIALNITAELALRALVLERRGVMDAISAAARLFQRRVGRTLLVWIIAVALGIGMGIATAIAMVIVLVPLGAIVLAGYAAGAFAGAVIAAIPALLLFILAAAVIGGITNTYSSVYWTLAFRRLDLEPAPMPAPRPSPPIPA